jgi:hypothetical protein
MEITIITVHGTFADRPSDYGDAWWQKDSAFVQALLSRLGQDIKIVPFHWSGRNQEQDRRSAGDALFELLLTEMEDNQTPIFLIAHSHGGNVVSYALDNFPYCERMARRQPFFSLKELNKEWFHQNYSNMQKASLAGRIAGWITIGTPFVRFAPRPHSTSVAYHLDTVRVAVFGLALLGLGYLVSAGPWRKFDYLPIIFGFVVLMYFMGKVMSMGEPRISSSMNKGTSSDLILDRWLGVSSRIDEAIWSLRLSLTQKVRIPGRTISSRVELVLLLALDFTLLASILYIGATYLTKLESASAVTMKGGFLTARFLALCMLTVAYLFSGHLVRSATRRWIEPLCGKILTDLFGAIARGAACGVDAAAIMPVGVEVSPQGARSDCWILDDAADERLLAGVRSDRERFFSLTYSSIREGNMAGAFIDVALRDPFLVHNRYFGEEAVISRLSRFILEGTHLPRFSGLEDEVEQLHQMYVKW